jgi:hypothetical protein
MTIKERRIFHINDLVGNIDNTQFCFEPIEDPDVGFRMFGYKTDDGDTFKCLAKDQNARIKDLVCLGNSYGSSGYLMNDSDGNITGGNSGAGVTDHGALSGLQGGTTYEYFHFTSGQHSALTGVTATEVLFGSVTAGVVNHVSDFTYNSTLGRLKTSQLQVSEFLDLFGLDEDCEWVADGVPLSLSVDDWNDYRDAFGEVGIMRACIAAYTAGGGSLDDAYNIGRSITADAGYVGITVPSGGSSSVLSLSNLEDENADDLLSVYQTCTTGYSIYLGGNDGGDYGLRIGSDVQCSFVRVNGDYTSKLHYYDGTVETGSEQALELSVRNVNASYSAELIMTVAYDESDYISGISMSAQTVSIAALTGDLALNSISGSISCSDSPLTNITNLSYHDVDTPSGTSTLTVNFLTGSAMQSKSISGNVTAVTLTAPPGPSMSLALRIATDGTARSITGFADGAVPIKWGCTVDANSAALTIAANSWTVFTMQYWGATIGWLITAVEPAP